MCPSGLDKGVVWELSPQSRIVHPHTQSYLYHLRFFITTNPLPALRNFVVDMVPPLSQTCSEIRYFSPTVEDDESSNTVVNSNEPAMNGETILDELKSMMSQRECHPHSGRQLDRGAKNNSYHNAPSALMTCAHQHYETCLVAAKRAAQKPIKFKDCVGRKFSFPYYMCETWTVRLIHI